MKTPLEISWFCPLCDDDYRQLGVVAPELRSSYGHCRDILLRAEGQSFDNILLPSAYAIGIDNKTFAAALAPQTSKMKMLLAVRCGEMWVPQLARELATIDQMMGGRLTINIISSDRPGEQLSSEARYQRTREEMQVLRTLLNGEPVSFRGEFLQLEVAPPKARLVHGRCPPMYFGGLSDNARDVAAAESDVFLMWPETLAGASAILDDMRQRAAAYGRTLRYGYRVHIIVRETEAEARAAASHLVAALDAEEGEKIRARSQDSQSFGVQRQASLRDQADNEGYVEDNLWTGIGRARSGCGAAIVGDPDQVADKLWQYAQLGFDSFILSGYPHAAECELVGRYVLPRLRERAATGD
ncbi:MAG: LLM class flavin-dependent oxidoreductase [Myxococcota bacterium]